MKIFVFGSNLAGRHGAGAAKVAMQRFHATWGLATGRQGSAYAIPTKDEKLRPLHLPTIQMYVLDFLDYATKHPELVFNVTRIGCGLAGYSDEAIAPMFEEAPDNCHLPGEWRKLCSARTNRKFRPLR